MKITRVETVYYEDNDRFLWVRLHTDDGFVGLGETYVHAAPARAMIEHTFAPHFLLGCNPLQREAIWRDLFERCNYVGWAGAEIRAISAIDIALWDIIAQVSAQPLYQLLGGATRPAIPVYNTCGPQPDFDFRRNPGPLAQDLLAQGISIMKIWPFDEIAAETRGQRIDPWHLEAALQPFREIREATAGRMQVAVEFHGHWNLPSAVRIARALEDYDILWLEDLLPADNLEALQTLAASTRLPLVISERLFTRYQFLPLLQSGAAQIVNPDIEWCGGISEALKIAALAETFHIPVAFHNYGGPLLNAVTAHVATAIPNLMIVETGRDLLAHWEDEGVLTNNVSVQNGMITPFSEPGLGTSLRAEFLSRENVRVNYIDLV